MLVKKMRSERAVWVGILSIAIALNGSPAFADEGGEGLFSSFFSKVGKTLSSLFQPQPQAAETSAPVEEISIVTQPSPSPSPSLEPSPVVSPVASQESALTPPALPVTHDSSYQIPGTVPPTARWILVETKKDDGPLNDPFIAVTPGAPMPTVYFPNGAGVYTVKVYFSDKVRVDDGTLSKSTEFKVQNDDSRDIENLAPSLMVQSDAPEIIELAQKITLGKVTDREKALAIHDWMAGKISYDEEGLKDGSYTSRSVDALTTLNLKLSVCDGFANLYAALARAVGLRTKVIIGKRFHARPAELSLAQICEAKSDPRLQAHGWNEVNIDGRWVSLDVSQVTGYTLAPQLLHEYFDRNVSDFERTYQKCSEAGR